MLDDVHFAHSTARQGANPAIGCGLEVGLKRHLSYYFDGSPTWVDRTSTKYVCVKILCPSAALPDERPFEAPMQDPTPEETMLAEDLVQTATARLAKVLPGDALLALRDLLTDELLSTASGRRRLRALLEDRQVEASGTVPRADERSTPKGKTGS